MSANQLMRSYQLGNGTVLRYLGKQVSSGRLVVMVVLLGTAC